MAAFHSDDAFDRLKTLPVVKGKEGVEPNTVTKNFRAFRKELVRRGRDTEPPGRGNRRMFARVFLKSVESGTEDMCRAKTRGLWYKYSFAEGGGMQATCTFSSSAQFCKMYEVPYTHSIRACVRCCTAEMMAVSGIPRENPCTEQGVLFLSWS